MSLKSVFKSVIAWPLLPECLGRLTKTHATVFMSHRFSAPELGVSGQDPQALRQTLAELRKRRYHLISLEELFRRLRQNERIERAVAFTIDDGYLDQGLIAGPVFAEFDCPVTIFTVTDFADGKIWLWWDRIEWIFEQTRQPEIVAHLGAQEFRFPLKTEADRRSFSSSFAYVCQESPHEDRMACLQELSRMAEVELPASPPPRYRSLSWDQMRSLERKGMSFGPHTLTHPVLASTSDEHSEREIVQSWQRLKEQVSHPVPVFCYPAGGPEHFGDREVATVHRIGLEGAVTAFPVHHRIFEDGTRDRYRLTRWGLTDELANTFQCLSGVGRLKSRLRALSNRNHELPSHPTQ